ncbi:hypothetical protein Sulku_0998 [Sulfuricurvum kujiense DSM 16994]|uniref:Uncharacterized protein n=1 Tax=Sulfuricurvum kujiense (strain ATCC BAA-921 / DSM 16994 / JCM 11577 / YK-1) TaxID=709032 RepID=E4U2S6_SULKY|nr:hypothetical protein Sulku_0998 [Sulfuricurvum kujiense DSM 16994]
MGKINFLIIGLGISVIIYLIYRHTFLKQPKKKMPHKPHFTLKVESE